MAQYYLWPLIYRSILKIYNMRDPEFLQWKIKDHWQIQTYKFSAQLKIAKSSFDQMHVRMHCHSRNFFDHSRSIVNSIYQDKQAIRIEWNKFFLFLALYVKGFSIIFRDLIRTYVYLSLVFGRKSSLLPFSKLSLFLSQGNHKFWCVE